MRTSRTKTIVIMTSASMLRPGLKSHGMDLDHVVNVGSPRAAVAGAKTPYRATDDLVSPPVLVAESEERDPADSKALAEGR
jgi:hypothetical protein